ncbi:hypothetical protein HYT74_00580 [Candidatus Daviesbacteria bacterium]|nr:hypothetical protein [Candidatus Daviesbacteria bacterium]
MVENPNINESELAASFSSLTIKSIEESMREVEEVLNGLTHRERRVLQLRFGLDDGRSKSFAEVGEIVGMELRGRPYSIGWMRQTEARALYNLRHPFMPDPSSK